MSIKVFQDKVFPRHVSDLMNLMHMVIFSGTDGEEKWPTYLTSKQKEYVALALARYYQCEHCIEHHSAALAKLEDTGTLTVTKNINSMVLFLRIDTRTISGSEKTHWTHGWKRFAEKVTTRSDDKAIPYLIGLGIGIARNDDFLIDFCGSKIKQMYATEGLAINKVIGELEAVVVFMKAAVSKNRVASKLDDLLGA